ncbi:MAG: phage virion morphogenesis protein [Spirochaetales bacterium]|nr:phage virion morphogenesis protein [Spirochaetales bacterium]
MLGIGTTWNPQSKIEKLIKSLGDEQSRRKLNIALVEEIRAGVMQNFNTESEDGVAWQPLAAVTMKRRKKPTLPILLQNSATGLKGSIQTETSETGGKIYTKKVYARAQHAGNPKQDLPARPFMTITEKAQKGCAEILHDWYVKHKDEIL